MKGVTSEVISDVRNKAKIIDVISELVVLKRAGKDYKGLCPFHNEKSPSFFVNPDKGIFKCFGCGEGGDVFAFVQKTKRLDFIDAVRELAQKTGVALIETSADQGAYDKRAMIMLLYQQASEYYSRLLGAESEGQFARDYLQDRGIGPDIISKFKLGLASNAWDGLLRYLQDSAKASPETLVEAGLVRRKVETNHFYDLFRNRLMIPIQDEQGRVIAFGGRTLGDDQVKYINSPESPIYTKGEHLFALPQAKDAIREKDSVIVVEGYFDAISAHQCGFTNTVATLGTALTERQGKLLVRFTESRRVFLCFDSDSAGEKAVSRGTETLKQIAEGIGIELRVVSVPDGKDPDESLRSKSEKAGPAGFARALESASRMLDYQLEKAVSGSNLTSHSGRIDAAKHLIPVLASIKDAVSRGEYVRQWALKLGIKEEDLLADVSQMRRQLNLGAGAKVRENFRPQLRKNAPKAGDIEAELSILALYLLSREDYQLLKEKLADFSLTDPAHQRIKEAIEGIGSFINPQDFWQSLQDRLAADMEAAERLWDLDKYAEQIRKQNLPIGVILNDCESRIVRERLKRAADACLLKIRQKPGEEEEEKLSLKITLLTRLQQELTSAPEGLEVVKRKLESLLVET